MAVALQHLFPISEWFFSPTDEHTYKQALQHCKIVPKQSTMTRNSLPTSNRSSSPNSFNNLGINENEVKFKIASCHCSLNENRAALVEMEGIPNKARNLQMNIMMGKLYQNSRHTRSSIACYKECLRHCPYVIEAIVALAELGVASKDIISIFPQGLILPLVPSAALAKELEVARVTAGNKIRLWNKGVDSESFYPKYRAQEMRIRLSNREPKRPLIVHVGRLGVEKSLDLLKSVMDQIPEARIAFIGDGPYRENLEKLFSGMPAVFTGMLGGVASLLGKRSMSFLAIEVCDHETIGVEDDLSDDGSQAGEKKRRLNLEQVKTLEKNFELGNKLESERKMQLALLGCNQDK
ncbi:Sulfoquinovosyl transferase SQD2 [Camellia lanceoleosa]|uniref:Sulfoquinovosyl transferase SQD2 n=1 Tax=Camellia lanceoleosa TaxID=1840588 RepID=A0ACC0HCY6_9ERIC|nr:Sulfoquinovosyl transferase SQD2 [Camellia lanceoleosa]